MNLAAEAISHARTGRHDVRVPIVGHHRFMPVLGRRDLEQRGQGSDRLVKRGAPLEGRGVSRAARGAPVAPSPQVREAWKAYLDHLHVPFDV